MEGQDLWREWKGGRVDSAGWWREQQEELGDLGRVDSRVVERDQVYDKG